MQAEFSQTGDGVVTHSINITIVHNNVKYNAAGQVISAQVKNGKLESYIGYNANNFAWYNPVNGKMELFMAAKNGQFFIREAFIGDATITSAKIADVLQSANFSHANKVGYQLNMRTGEEIKYGNNAQGYWIETNILKRLFDKNGTMRIRMGIW
ncbi:phage tail tip fiber protein [Proteus mirabilis]